MIQHAQVFAAPAGEMTALEMQHANDIGKHFVIASRIDGGANEINVAADAGKILLELGVKAAVGFLLLSRVL